MAKATINFYPIRWFEDATWKTIQVFGRLHELHETNNSLPKSAFIRVGFQPYFTVKYPNNILADDISQSHAYLTSRLPVASIKQIILNLYRFYFKNKNDYYETSAFYEKNGLGQIIDLNQDVKSKFFAQFQINPGSWQQVTGLRPLIFNSPTKYSVADYEYSTNNITTINPGWSIPLSKIVFFDIEAIPSDNLSFPDAVIERPPDIIFAISVIISFGTSIQRIVYILTDSDIPERYTTDPTRTGQAYDVKIVTVDNEEELLIQFFNDLSEVRPDRIVSMNGRQFDINYIGTRVRLLGLTLPPFSKVVSYHPTFYQTVIKMTQPYIIYNQVLALGLPGVSQIDLLDFYRRLYPNLGNHKLETLARLILGRGKTGLSIPELFAKFRSGYTADIEEIVDYSVMDSIILLDLWEASQVDSQLSLMSNFWKNDAEYTLTHDMDGLYNDLSIYLKPDIPPKQFKPGKPIATERESGIFRDVYLYSLSRAYLSFIEQSVIGLPSVPEAYNLKDYTSIMMNYLQSFENTPSVDSAASVAFKSGYFPVKYDQFSIYLKTILHSFESIWIDEQTVAVKGVPPMSSDDFGPINNLVLISYYPLVLVSGKSWVIVDSLGLIYKKGMSLFVRPPFPLVNKYINYLIDTLLNRPNEPIVFPNFETNLDDFVLETKVTAEDFTGAGPKKSEIVEQLKQLGTPISTTWRKVSYIKVLINGETHDVVSEIFLQNPTAYMAILDLNYYTETVKKIVYSVFK